MEEEGLHLLRDTPLCYLREAESLEAPPPEWTTTNRIILDLDTLRLLDFTVIEGGGVLVPVLVDAPFSNHSSTIADYARGQSLVDTLLASGLEGGLVVDWKSATDAMRDYDIDKYLVDIDRVVDKLDGRFNLVGLWPGGWMSATYT